VKLVIDGYFSDEPLPNDEMAKVNDKEFFNHTILNEISDSGDNLNVHPTGDEGIAVSVAPDPIPISVDTEQGLRNDLFLSEGEELLRASEFQRLLLRHSLKTTLQSTQKIPPSDVFQ
jgi:hypothetical protein